MSRGQALGFLGTATVVVGLLASIGPAAQSVRDGIAFLWPTGVVVILVAACLGLLWERHRMRNTEVPSSIDEPGPADSSESTEQQHVRQARQAAYSAILTTSEAYINAHRAVDDLAYPGVYTPDLEAAEAAVDQANQNFVAARQAIEQFGTEPVLTATRDIEESINKREFDSAAEMSMIASFRQYAKT